MVVFKTRGRRKDHGLADVRTVWANGNWQQRDNLHALDTRKMARQTGRETGRTTNATQKP